MRFHPLVTETLAAMVEERFDILLTSDKSLRFQQNLSSFHLQVVILITYDNRLKALVERIDEIEKVRNEALKTNLQGIIAALEGMKIRKDRFFVLQEAKFPITLILGKQDPVLNYNENILQTENTKVQLITFDDGHMSWIENRLELLEVLVKLFVI